MQRRRPHAPLGDVSCCSCWRTTTPELPCDPASPLLGIYLKGTRAPPQSVPELQPTCASHICQDREPAACPSTRVHEEMCVRAHTRTHARTRAHTRTHMHTRARTHTHRHAQSRTLFSHQGGNPAACHNMDGLEGPCWVK